MKREIRKGYYVRLLVEHWILGGCFIEGRIVKVWKSGFLLAGRGWCEYVPFDRVIAYRWGRYG